MRDERGTIAVMSIGFLLLLGALMVVVVDASAAFLQRQEMNNLADGAALAAADGLDAAQFYQGRRIVLNESNVRALIGRHIAGSGAKLTALGIDAEQVRLRLEREMDLPVVPPGWRSRTTVIADASASLQRAP